MGNLLKFSILIAISSAICYYFYPDLQVKVLNSLIKLTDNLWNNQVGEKANQQLKCLDKNEKLFTPEELSKYDGTKDGTGIYLAFLGIVYDVTKGAQHYRPGGGYSFFSGKDATRAFITGEFNEAGLVDDLDGIDSESFGGVKTWVDLYESEYKKIGKVVGSYYDNQGCPTDKLQWVHQQIADYESKQAEEIDETNIFPYCNSEWDDVKKQGRVWCSRMSGGTQRDWIGVPRQLFNPEKKTYRCACVKDHGPPSLSNIQYAEDNDNDFKSSSYNDQLDVGDINHPRLKEYDGCQPNSFECITKD